MGDMPETGGVSESYPTNGDGNPICGRPKDSEPGECENVVSERGEACFLHGDEDLPDRWGAPEGNDNAVGNDGGDGAPDGNFFALETGEHTSAKRRLEFLVDESEEDMAKAFADAYIQAIEKGADPMGAVHIATAEAFQERLEREMVREGLQRDLYHEGELVARVFDNDRSSAITSFMRESRLRAREEAITNYSRGDSGGQAHGNKERLVDADAWGDA